MPPIGKRNLIRILVVAAVFFCGSSLGTYLYLSRDLPSTARLEAIEPSLKTQIYAADSTLIGEFFQQNRALIPLEEIPEYMKNAIIAIEDRKFYQHWGVDIYGIARALFKDLLARKVVQGASTITQQLARNLFLTFDVSIQRKLREMILALKIERAYSKDEILEMYLNQIYFGSGAYGVEAAARTFFGKGARKLTLGEAALLAGLPKNPRDYSPFHHLERAMRRRRVVLDAMVECGMLERAEADSVKMTPVVLREKGKVEEKRAAYFLEYVRQYLETRYGAERIYHGGLRVYTTLDPYLQSVAEDSMEANLERIEAAHDYPQTMAGYREELAWGGAEPPRYLQSAVVALDVRTGAIRAMVGGRSFRHSKFNRAVQARRQPGSAFKPFIYITALENGFAPSQTVLDAPIVLELPNGDIWKPHNFSETFEGEVSLRHALDKSINVAAVRLLMSLGPVAVINYAHRLGIKSPLQGVYSLALGTLEVTLMELTSAYATLGAGGVKAEPFAVAAVIDRDGRILERRRVYREEVLSPQTSYMITNMLASVLEEGTGRSARLLGFKEPAAGKTGTTDDCTDAWFIGYTTELAVGVWTGFDEKKSIGPRMTGARVSLPVWTDVMKAYYRDHKGKDFSEPAGIIHRVVCEETGLLASNYCQRIRKEVFIAGTEPRRRCDRHGLGGGFGEEENIYRRDIELLHDGGISPR